MASSLAWLSESPHLRSWFNQFLREFWKRIYGSAYWKVLLENPNAAQRLSEKLCQRLPTLVERPAEDQVRALNRLMGRLGFTTTEEQVVDELRYHLKRRGHLPKNEAAYRASPWSNYHAIKTRLQSRMGFDLISKCYKDLPHLEAALGTVISELLSRGITRAGQLNSPPLRERRDQILLRGRVRQFLQMRGDLQTGPSGLARFLVSLFRAWPSVPAGLNRLPLEFLGSEAPGRVIREHLGTRGVLDPKLEKTLRLVFSTIVRRNELRTALLKLALHAQQSPPKGWDTLRKHLTEMFRFKVKKPSAQARVTDLMIQDWPTTKGKVNASTASGMNKRLAEDEKNFDKKKEGKSDTEKRMRRAAKQIQEEFGLKP